MTFNAGDLRSAKPALSRLVGRAITGVKYIRPRRGGGIVHGDDVHEVEHGVVLSLGDGQEVASTWEEFDDSEFLSISPQLDRTQFDHDVIDIVDVSDLPEWRSRIGAIIESVGVSRCILANGSRGSIWSLRIQLSNGADFVVALGEVVDGIPKYLPDAVVVIFSRSVAESLNHPEASSSSWGESVEGLD